jgi:peptidoglycan/LPS O-acetylase OafA/YrhL
MQSSDTHIYSFDLTRAFAALAVVLLHWTEYTVPGSAPPFEHHLLFFFRFGAFAVPMFFVLSGFIFDWLYTAAIESRRIDAVSFFALRFSRLYPLFVITFLVVAIELWLSNGRTGYSFDYLYTDGYHTILTLLMMTGWGLEQGFSFNGPSWTVSTEIFLYGVFFVIVRRYGIGPRSIAAMIAIGVVLTPVSVHLAGGLVQFFAGVAAHRLFLLWSRQRGRGWIIAATAASAVLILLYSYEYHSQTGLALLRDAFPRLPKLATRYQIVRDMIFPAIVFPMIAFIQAAAENTAGRRAIIRHSFVTWAGNVSYSLYLWHYPLMIAFALIAIPAGASRFIFYSPAILILYLVLLFAISHLSYYAIERPLMRAIRARFVTRDRGARTEVAADTVIR